jgi:hypothetical protein
VLLLLWVEDLMCSPAGLRASDAAMLYVELVASLQVGIRALVQSVLNDGDCVEAVDKDSAESL